MKGPVLTILVAIGLCLKAQNPLVKFEELSYRSEFEKSQFNGYFIAHQQNYLPLFLSLNSNLDERGVQAIDNQLRELAGEIRAASYFGKKSEKLVKGVYQKVHDTFLKKYELENRFHEIFESGNYNCLTATALFALVFEEINIPYTIKEEPTHVYLVAYPNEANILVETTTPASGFLNFDQSFKNTFINNLKNQKLIGKTEFESNTIDHLFNKYYFSNESIDLKKLIGLHYLNDALYLREKMNLEESFKQAEKAYLFYPSQKSQYILASLGAELTRKSGADPIEKSKLIAKLSRHGDMGITPDMIKAEFESLTHEVLIRQNNKMLYNQCFEIFAQSLEDRSLLTDISYYFYYENGRLFYNQGEFEKARDYFKISLALQPNNVELGLILSQCLAQSLKTQKSSTAILDTMRIYMEQFPALMDIQNFKSMMAAAYILEFQSMYSKGMVKQGDIHKKEFEDLMNGDERIFIHPDIVGLSYSTASTYYFKKGQKSVAKELLERGLKYAPGNYELRSRLQMLSR